MPCLSLDLSTLYFSSNAPKIPTRHVHRGQGPLTPARARCTGESLTYAYARARKRDPLRASFPSFWQGYHASALGFAAGLTRSTKRLSRPPMIFTPVSTNQFSLCFLPHPHLQYPHFEGRGCKSPSSSPRPSGFKAALRGSSSGGSMEARRQARRSF